MCRVLDAFVARLALSELGFERAQAAETGRPGYDPRDLLKLYLYGYLNQIRSSRRLEAECRRNVELMWLLGRLYPDHKSFSEFRRMHSEAVTAAGCGPHSLCKELWSYRGEWIAIDGSKFRAVASVDSTRERLDLQRYLEGIKKADEEQGANIDQSAVQAAVQRLKQHPEPEAGYMLVRQTALPAYNVQTAVDAEHALRVLPCDGCIVFAGFWNTHVHFTGPQWDKSDRVPADQLSRDMQPMLTHSGFTTVVDLSSDPINTTALRRRVESGEVAGPRIYTAGFGLYPPHGIPFYLDDLPATLLARLPQPATPATAVEAVQQNQALGSDVVKLFTGSYLTPNNITHMPLDIARSAVSEGHRHSQLAFAHPSDLQGVRIALDSGVDVLAHAPDTVGGVDDALVKEMVARHMAIIPTLKLFSGSGHIDRIRDIVTCACTKSRQPISKSRRISIRVITAFS